MVGYILIVVQLVISIIALGGVLGACMISLWGLKLGGRVVHGCILEGLFFVLMGGENGMKR